MAQTTERVSTTEGLAVPTPLPLYMLRVGVLDRVDVGFRPNLLSLGADVKWNPIRGRVDVALAPSVHGVLWETEKDGYNWFSHLPVIVAYNLHRDAAIGMTGGGVLRGNDTNDYRGFELGPYMHFRTTRRFSFLMGLHWVRMSDDDGNLEQFVVIGTGFSFAYSPEYDDLR